MEIDWLARQDNTGPSTFGCGLAVFNPFSNLGFRFSASSHRAVLRFDSVIANAGHAALRLARRSSPAGFFIAKDPAWRGLSIATI